MIIKVQVYIVILIFVSFLFCFNSQQFEQDQAITNFKQLTKLTNKNINDSNADNDFKQMYVLKHLIEGPHGWIDTVRITQDGHKVSLTSDKSVYIYHYNQSIYTFGPNPAQVIALDRTIWAQDLSRNHQKMILGGAGNTLASFQLTSNGYQSRGYFDQPDDEILSIKMTPEGDLFVAAGFIKQPLVYYRNVSDPHGYSLLQTLPSVNNPSSATSITYNQQFLSIADGNKVIIFEKVLDENSTQDKFRYKNLHQLGNIDPFQITSMHSCIISYINSQGKQQMFQQQKVNNLRDIKIEKSLLVTASTDEWLRIYHYNSILNKFFIFQQINIQNEKILTLSVVADGKNLAIGTSGKKVIIYQLQSDKQQQIYISKWIQTQSLKIGCWIRSIRFSVTNGKSLIVGGDDGKFRVYEVGKCNQQIGQKLINGQCILEPNIDGLSTVSICLIAGGSLLFTFLLGFFTSFKIRKRIQKCFLKNHGQSLLGSEQQVSEKSLNNRKSGNSDKSKNSSNSSKSSKSQNNKKKKVEKINEKLNFFNQNQKDKRILRSSLVLEKSSHIKQYQKQPFLEAKAEQHDLNLVNNINNQKVEKKQKQRFKPRVIRTEQKKQDQKQQVQQQKQNQKAQLTYKRQNIRKQQYNQKKQQSKKNTNQAKQKNLKQEQKQLLKEQNRIQKSSIFQVNDANVQKNKKIYGLTSQIRSSYQQQQH